MEDSKQLNESRLRLKEIETALAQNPSLSVRCELEDEALEIKERLGDFERNKQCGGEGCEFCSA